MNNGIICKDKGIEKYALENYGRLSGMTTIGIIVTALTEYQPFPEKSKALINVDWDGLCNNLNTYMRKKDNDLTIDFLKELFEGYVGCAQSHQVEMPGDEDIDREFPVKSETTALTNAYINANHNARIGAKWFKSQLK